MPILQKSIKLTNEPPCGLKANMLRAYGSFTEAVWENSSKQSELKAIIFALCFFHSVVCERRKFGPIGWNRGYPFNPGDLSAASPSPTTTSRRRAKVPWDDLRYLFGEIMYGGHITDNWDRRLCAAYLRTYVREELLDGLRPVPGLRVPPPTLSYKQYLEYIDETSTARRPSRTACTQLGDQLHDRAGEALFSAVRAAAARRRRRRAACRSRSGQAACSTTSSRSCPSSSA